jgi:hypothetical protein
VDSVYNQIMDGNRRLFGGEVTSEDADGASLFASARNLLGNPYALVSGLEEMGGLEGIAATAMRAQRGHSDAGGPETVDSDPGGPPPLEDSGETPVDPDGSSGDDPSTATSEIEDPEPE